MHTCIHTTHTYTLCTHTDIHTCPNNGWGRSPTEEREYLHVKATHGAKVPNPGCKVE